MTRSITKKQILFSLLFILAIAIRLMGFDYITDDYKDFLSKWVNYYRLNGGFKALAFSIGNYNIPYLYFLAFFSYIPINDLYLIKGLSCLFDVLLAWTGGQIAEKCGGKKYVAFFVILFLPTVIINGSLWAQCDSIYVALALFGILLALEDKPFLSVVFIALSFGFKLQSVFIMPVYMILWIYKKFKWYHFTAFPVTYFLLILPAVLIGLPFEDAFLLYFNQADTVGDAPNYNAPSLTALTQSIDSNTLIVIAFISMFTVILLAVLLRNSLTERKVIALSVLMVTVIPFFLPHMHDRYFFAADVLSCILAVSFLPAIPGAVFMQFGSLVCYIAYLNRYYMRLGHIYLTNGRGAVSVILSIIVCIYSLLFITYEDDKLSTIEKKKTKKKQHR